jgi:hypothetical protein
MDRNRSSTAGASASPERWPAVAHAHPTLRGQRLLVRPPLGSFPDPELNPGLLTPERSGPHYPILIRNLEKPRVRPGSKRCRSSQRAPDVGGIRPQGRPKVGLQKIQLRQKLIPRQPRHPVPMIHRRLVDTLDPRWQSGRSRKRAIHPALKPIREPVITLGVCRGSPTQNRQQKHDQEPRRLPVTKFPGDDRCLRRQRIHGTQRFTTPELAGVSACARVYRLP